MWQHIIVLILVAACLAYVAWQGYKTFSGRRSKLGACCSKGCDPAPREGEAKPERMIFLPVEMLSRRSNTPRRKP